MTPFMQRVDDLVQGASDRPLLESSASQDKSIGQGLHEQVELRGLAEQYTSEANVVLRGGGPLVQLSDEAGGEHLAFSLTCGRSRAIVVTDISGRQARARLLVNGNEDEQREIAGPEGLATLLLGLIADRHPLPKRA